MQLSLLRLSCSLLAASPLAAQSGHWTEADQRSGPEPRSHYGQAVAFLGDLNGDGVAEIGVGAPLATNGATGTSDGYAEVLDGATRALLRSHTGITEPGGGLGTAITRTGDLDGDGVEDYAISEPKGAGSRSRLGLVHAYSGATGVEIWTAEGTQPWALFGTEVVRIQDTTGDGIDDLVVSEPDWSSSIFEQWVGRVHLVSGVDGQRVRTLQGTEESDYFGQRIGLVGDVDGDGVDDVGIAWRGPAFDTPGYLSIYSAATMQRLTVLEGPPTAVFDPTGWGRSFCALGDLDGDGADEFAVAAPWADRGIWHRTGSVTVYRGRTGEELWTVSSLDQYSEFGHQIEPAGDVDGDGAPDLLVAQPDVFPIGAIHLLSGRDGRLLASFQADGRSDDWALEIATGADLNGDGHAEILVGALEDDVFSTGPGRLDILSWDPLVESDTLLASNSAGGSLQLDVDFPDSEAGQSYAVLLSLTGPGPTLVGEHWIPLTRDDQFERSLRGGARAPWADAYGTLDVDGATTIRFDWAPGTFAGEAGLTYWGCVVTYDAAGVRMASAALPLRITR